MPPSSKKAAPAASSVPPRRLGALGHDIDWALPPRRTTMLGDQISPTDTQHPPPYWNRGRLSSSLYRQPVASTPPPAAKHDSQTQKLRSGLAAGSASASASAGANADDSGDGSLRNAPGLDGLDGQEGSFVTGVEASSSASSPPANPPARATAITTASSSSSPSSPLDPLTPAATPPPPAVLVRDLAPKGRQSLSAIAVTSFSLGAVSGLSAGWAAWAVCTDSAFVRLPVFLVALCVFHLLEFWATAAYNTSVVEVDSFLLFANGPAYTLAHTCATIEFVATTLASQWYSSSSSSSSSGGRLLSTLNVPLVGAALIVVGQAVRTAAMAQAGKSFHHQVQETRAATHTLVTSGLYAVMRHPAYFGFFWWAVGTQLMLGNRICLLGYCVVLYRFFSSRIRREEAYLVKFFGGRYVDYRKRTPTLIPFVK